MRRVSLFTRAGNFFAYVTVTGTPRVIFHKGKCYVAFDAQATTNSFRECEYERAKGG